MNTYINKGQAGILGPDGTIHTAVFVQAAEKIDLSDLLNQLGVLRGKLMEEQKEWVQVSADIVRGFGRALGSM